MSSQPRTPLPPRARLPKPLAQIGFVLWREPLMHALRSRFGDAFTMQLPLLGESLVVSHPELVRQTFQAPPDALTFGDENPLGAVLGPGSLFSMDGEQHLAERRLILPAFHGRRMQGYEPLIEREALRELERWPVAREFPSMPAFMRITLHAILRTVFGAEGADVEQLAGILPPLVTLGSRLSFLPALQRDLGPLSPGGRFRRIRARYDRVIDRMIDARLADRGLEQRDDVLSLLLGAHYEDGSTMSRSAIADELLTLLAAGHETTATTLAWAVERLRRNPAVLDRLTAEARAGGREYRIATIHEVQRTRPVIVATNRHAQRDFPLGPFTVPAGHHILVSATAIHRDPRFFERPLEFDPQRFIDRKPETYTWIPFGGGTRRCLGAAFAHMEMDVVLRTLLCTFDLAPTADPDERWRNRGIAYAPARGGRLIVHTLSAGAGARPSRASGC